MTLSWDDFVDSLGEPESSARFASLLSKIGEAPVLVDVAKDYPGLNYPTGTTRFYQFFQFGLEFGIRHNGLYHVHFWLHHDKRYGAYAGPMPVGVVIDQDEPTIVSIFGNPTRSGGPEPSPLLGFIHRWIRYDIDERYAIRYEFSPEGDLQKLSLFLVMP
jgi:filamentous hemagglutinin